MTPSDWKTPVCQMAAGIRRRVLAHTIAHNGGYLNQACSSAEILATLYGKILKLAPLGKPLIPGRFPGTPKPGKPAVTGAAYNGNHLPECDNFILSPAQYALVLYAALIEAGRMDENGMKDYNADGGSVEMIGAEHSPGMEVTTGSLGQGISQAAGIAFARQIKGETGRVVMLMSDGECQSGQFWEAVQAASYHQLGNMLIYVDVNGYQCDGAMTDVMNIEPFDQRLKAFGAKVYRIDGHNIEKIAETGTKKQTSCVPVFVLCDTDPCRGMPFLEKRKPKFHYVRLTNPQELAEFQSCYKNYSLSHGSFTP